MAFGPRFPNELTFEDWERWSDERERFLSAPGDDGRQMFVKKKQFLSGNETTFLLRLRTWFPELDIHCQVQLMRLVEVDHARLVADLTESLLEQSARTSEEYKQPTSKQIQAARWRHHNLFNLLSCDFVLSDKFGIPLCVIELDGDEHRYDADVHQVAVKQEQAAVPDKSGAGAQAVERTKGWHRDAIKDLVLQAAGIPILRVENEAIYQTEALEAFRQRILTVLENRQLS